MQDSSAFQFIAVDQIHESTTNPRLTFEPSKLEELAESIRQHGLIQPITVRPNASGFEIVAGARRFRAAQLAELFSLPARIVELTNAQAMEWQLVENSQRVDVHPYEEAQGFQRLLDFPGYDITALVEKSGKSASHIYARLSLLQLIPAVAEAFVQERITASHANLIARLPQEHQAAAFENCWRKDWSDKEAHLLPAKHLSAWIQANLYLNLAEAPFDREDALLKPEAGACVTCPRRSGHNTSLFHDVQGDQCLDAPCYQAKVTAHIDRQLAARPELVTIETAWRTPKERHPGALQVNQTRELAPENPDAEPPCSSAKPAIIVFGKHAGRTVTICLDAECPVHHPQTVVQRPADRRLSWNRQQNRRRTKRQNTAKPNTSSAWPTTKPSRSVRRRSARPSGNGSRGSTRPSRAAATNSARQGLPPSTALSTRLRPPSAPNSYASSCACLCSLTTTSLRTLPLTSPTATRTRSSPTRKLCWQPWTAPQTRS